MKKVISLALALLMIIAIMPLSTLAASAVQVAVTYNNNGIITRENVTVGEALPTPTSDIEGNEFLGWYLDTTWKYEVPVVPNYNVTVYAKWTTTVIDFKNLTDVSSSEYGNMGRYVSYGALNANLRNSNGFSIPAYDSIGAMPYLFKEGNQYIITVVYSATVDSNLQFRYSTGYGDGGVRSGTAGNFVNATDDSVITNNVTATRMFIASINDSLFGANTTAVYVGLGSTATSGTTCIDKIIVEDCGKVISADKESDVSWKLSGTKLTITGNGDMMDFTGSATPWDNEITEVVIEDGVTSIGAKAFYGCSNLKSVTIPASVKAIGEDAFYGCSNLTDVNITDLAAWCEIDFANLGASPVYYSEALLLDGEPVTKLEIPEGTTSVGNYAFYFCSNISSITIPDTVTSIGRDAFYGTAYYDRGSNWDDDVLRIGNHLIEVADSSIQGNYIIEDGILTVAGNAFANCTGITKIYVPNSVVSIGATAFGEESSLVEVWYCGSEYDTLTVDADNEILNSAAWHYNACSLGVYHEYENNCDVDCAVCGNIRTIKHTYDNTCDTDCNVCGATRVTEHIYDNSCDAACNICGATRQIQHAYLNSCDTYCEKCGVTRTIEHTYSNDTDPFCNVCNYYRDLSSDSISAGRSNNLAWVLDGTVLTISGKGVMANYTKENPAPWGTKITEVVIEDGVKSIGNRAFLRCGSLSKVTIADSVTHIGNNAFFRCLSLETIDLPDNLTTTGTYVFRYAGLKEIEIPASLTTINTGVFDCCEELEKITLLSTLTEVKEYAFLYNSSLKEVYFDSSEKYQDVISIASNNNKLKKATWYGNGITVGATLNVHWALEDSGKLTIYGEGSMASYPKNMGVDAPWGTDITEIVIEDGVTHIGHRAFFGCSKLEKVTIGNTVKAIGNNAFNGCELLTSVVIPDSVIRLDNTVFENCKALTEITLSKNIERFGIYCFTGSGLKTVYYNGNEADRANIEFDVGNNKIKKMANWVYAE